MFKINVLECISFVSWYSQSENERSKTFVMGKICANFNCSVSMLINDSKRSVLVNRSQSISEKKGQNQSTESVTFSFLTQWIRNGGETPKNITSLISIYMKFFTERYISRKSFSSSGKVHFSLFTSGLHLCKIKLFRWRILIYY